MAKSTKKRRPDKRRPDKQRSDEAKAPPRAARKKRVRPLPHPVPGSPPATLTMAAQAGVLDRLWSIIMSRRNADPEVSHSARLLGRGTAKVAQKFGEEAVECLIEAVAGNRLALVAESADVLYHLIVLWVDGGVRPEEVWNELERRQGISGIAEKASRAKNLPLALGLHTTKIP
jgi:phosphoribosyl-ATP pyrophosphohydrolase